MIFFSNDIFKAAGSDVHPNVAAIIVGMTQVVGACGASILMKNFGRKPLFIVSEIGMAISLAIMGVFFYLQEHETKKTENLGWLPLTCLVLYMVFYCVGGNAFII